MNAGYALFDHTADIGVRVTAGTLAELVQPAGEGLYAVIGQLVPDTAEPEPLAFDLVEQETALLLRDYLGELLHLFDCGRRIVSAVDVDEFDDTRLSAIAQTHALDEQRSSLHREVKAVTYHELSIRRVRGVYEATYIVDI